LIPPALNMAEDLIIYFAVTIPFAIILCIRHKWWLKRQRKMYESQCDMYHQRDMAHLKEQARLVTIMMNSEEQVMESIIKVADEKMVGVKVHRELTKNLNSIKRIKSTIESTYGIKPGSPYKPKAIIFSSN